MKEKLEPSPFLSTIAIISSISLGHTWWNINIKACLADIFSKGHPLKEINQCSPSYHPYDAYERKHRVSFQNVHYLEGWLGQTWAPQDEYIPPCPYWKPTTTKIYSFCVKTPWRPPCNLSPRPPPGSFATLSGGRIFKKWKWWFGHLAEICKW